MSFDERADQLAHLDDLARIEAVGRLVEDQQLRSAEQRLRDRHALPVSARELADQLVAVAAEREPLDDLVDRARAARAFEPAKPSHERQELVHAHLRVERHVLGNVADAPARLQALRDDVEAADLRACPTTGWR